MPDGELLHGRDRVRPDDGLYPAAYDEALFFADYSRDCIWAMKADAGGIPASGLLETFIAPAANPVDVQFSPAGELFYADFDGGTIRRIQFVSANQPPVAVATASPTSGAAPLTVAFDGSGSSDPNGDAITYAWDLDGDGLYDDSTAVQPTFTYTQSGSRYGAAQGHGYRQRVERQRPDRHHRQQPAHGDDRLSVRQPHLEGRRRDRVLRIGHRCAGRNPPPRRSRGR